MSETAIVGGFNQQQEHLARKLDELRQCVFSRVQEVKQAFERQTPLPDEGKQRKDLDKQFEGIALSVTNYNAECQKRMAVIEQVISERLDVSGFASIGDALIGGY